jgi:predicted PurR-regulated permease PerM
MNTQTLRYYFLIALIAASAVLTVLIFRPFLVVLVLAAIFAVVLQPLYRRMLRVVPRSPGLAASLTILIAVVCIMAPLTFIGVQVVGEAEQLYRSLSTAESGSSTSVVVREVHTLVAEYAPSMAVSETELSASVDQYSKEALAWLLHNLGGAFGGAARFLLSAFVFVIALYYLLRDGMRLKQQIIAASPLRDADDEVVFDRLEAAVNSVIRGSLTIALVQGVLTAIGFTLFGVPNSVLWGVVAALAALIPGFGTALVIAPAVLYLFITGATVPAIGLLVWGLVAVGLVDNVLGPKLIGKGMLLHPLIVLLSVLGGLAFFGAAGLFIGPLCVILLFSLTSNFEQISR